MKGRIKMRETHVHKLIGLLCALLLAGLFIAIAGLVQAKAATREVRARAKIISHFIHPSFRPSSDRTNPTQIRAPDDPNKQFDMMCDPNGQSRYNPVYPTNGMEESPLERVR
jgi:hypothetical protein